MKAETKQSSTTEELKRLYFTGANAGHAPSPGIAVASARVAGQS